MVKIDTQTRTIHGGGNQTRYFQKLSRNKINTAKRRKTLKLNAIQMYGKMLQRHQIDFKFFSFRSFFCLANELKIMFIVELKYNVSIFFLLQFIINLYAYAIDLTGIFFISFICVVCFGKKNPEISINSRRMEISINECDAMHCRCVRGCVKIKSRKKNVKYRRGRQF